MNFTPMRTTSFPCDAETFSIISLGYLVGCKLRALVYLYFNKIVFIARVPYYICSSVRHPH